MTQVDRDENASKTLLRDEKVCASFLPVQFESLPWPDAKLQSKAAPDHVILLHSDESVPRYHAPLCNRFRLKCFLLASLDVVFFIVLGFATNSFNLAFEFFLVFNLLLFACWGARQLLRLIWSTPEQPYWSTLNKTLYTAFIFNCLACVLCFVGAVILCTLRPHLSRPSINMHLYDRVTSVLESIMYFYFFSLAVVAGIYMAVIWVCTRSACSRDEHPDGALHQSITDRDAHASAAGVEITDVKTEGAQRNDNDAGNQYRYYCYDLSDKCVKLVFVDKETKEIVYTPICVPLTEIKSILSKHNEVTGIDECFIKRTDESLILIEDRYMQHFGGCEFRKDFRKILAERVIFVGKRDPDLV